MHFSIEFLLKLIIKVERRNQCCLMKAKSFNLNLFANANAGTHHELILVMMKSQILSSAWHVAVCLHGFRLKQQKISFYFISVLSMPPTLIPMHTTLLCQGNMILFPFTDTRISVTLINVKPTFLFRSTFLFFLIQLGHLIY